MKVPFLDGKVNTWVYNYKGAEQILLKMTSLDLGPDTIKKESFKQEKVCI